MTKDMGVDRYKSKPGWAEPSNAAQASQCRVGNNLVMVETRDKGNKITKGVDMLPISKELDMVGRKKTVVHFGLFIDVIKNREKPTDNHILSVILFVANIA